MQFYLSKAQAQIYQMEKVIGGSICNITGSALRDGYCDPELMGQAALAVYMHNDALRIRITEGRVPTQEVMPSRQDVFQSEVYEYVKFDSKREYDQWAQDIAKQPFGIDGSLCHLYGININDKCGGLLIVLHHLIGDAWTSALFDEQIFSYYNQLKAGKQIEPEEYSYLEYLQKEDTYIHTEQYEADKKYWKEQYQQELAAKICNKTAKSYKAKRLSISEERSRKIMELCKKKGVSVFNAYMTALGMYIARENRTNSCCIGTALLNRSNQREKNTMGMFVNTVGICSQFEEKSSFSENVHLMKRTLFDAMRHQKCNYVDAISSEAGAHLESLYDVYVSYQNIRLNSTQSDWYFCGMQNTSLAVSISDWAGKNELKFDYDYRVELFSEEEICAIHRHVIELLIHGLEEDVPWNELSVLPKWEKDDILEHFNNTDYDIGSMQSIKEVFEKQVKENRDKLALVFSRKKLTYGQLNEKSSQIAHLLQSMGVGTNDFVGLITERSCEMVEAIFGILKAGAAYVPISKHYPRERIEYIIEDCQPKVVLTFRAGVDFSCKVPVIELTDECIDGYSTKNPETALSGNDLAYAIYTSGTTGKPKGVLIEQKSVVSFCTCCKQNHFQKRLLECCDYVLAASNIAFDIHLQEIELPLLNGKTVLLIEEESEHGFGMLEEMLEAYNRIGVITTPTLMKARLDSAAVRKHFHHVTFVMAGAESFPPELLDRIQSCSDAVVVNGYGPTETTCGVLYSEVTSKNHIAIGSPIANTKAYVMYGKTLCGYGMTGELYIAGIGLARGYQNLEQQTKEAFVKHTFGEGKMYRTGDLVKLGCDGQIIYCGRIDEQVKIRGFRIELEEIRRNLLLCDEVKDGTVVVRKNEYGDSYLAAFFTADRNLDLDKLRVQLGKMLPDYMIPDSLMQIEKIPVNASGKIDKKQLPETIFQKTHAYTEPQTELQKAVAQAFCEVLHLKRAGLEDSFFEVGGDSIKALSVATYLREHQVEAHVSDIIQNKTVRLIAAALEEVASYTFSQEPVVGKVTMTPFQQEFFDWKLEKPEHFNQSVLVEIKEKLNLVQFHTCIHKLIEHHDMLRAVVVDRQLVIRKPEDMAGFAVKEYQCADDEIEGIIAKISTQLQETFQFGQGDLFQAALFQSEKRSFLFLVAHHLVVDGISWKSILSDLEALYHEKPIPDKEMSFTGWGDKLREYSQLQWMEQETAHWKNVVERLKQQSTYKRESQSVYQYASKMVCVPVTAVELEKMNRTAGFHMEEQILWKTVVAMKQWLHRDTISVMMEGNGRIYLTKDVQLEHTVGWFTNIYPVVLQGKTLEESARSVKEELRSVRFHGLGYGLAKDILQNKELQCETDLAFNYLGSVDEMLPKDGMFALSNLPCGQMVAKENRRLAPIIIDCSFQSGSLVLELSYNELVYTAAEIEIVLQMLSNEMCKTDSMEFAYQNGTPLRTDFYDGYMAEEDFEKICEQYEQQAIEKITDLTQMQEAIVYYKMLDEDSSAYFIQNSMSLTGKFDIQAAVKSARLLAYKHPVLRSRILYRGLKKPYSVQLKSAELEVNVFENKSPQTVMQDDLERGFDIEKDSLLRVAIVKEAKEQYKMVWSFHHSVIDGWCMDILYQDFIRHYKELVSKTADFNQLVERMKREESRPYSDYIAYRKLQNTIKGLDYWKGLLEDASESAELKSFGKGTEDGQVGTRIQFCSKEVTSQLIQLARRNQVTQNTVLETAWGMFLMRYSGMKDVVFGKTVSGRDAALDGIEGMIGLLINTVPVRVAVRKNMEVKELLWNIQRQAEETSQYDFCSLADIQKAAGLNKDFIKSLFVFENYEFHKGAGELLEGLSIGFDEVREQTDYDLSLAVSQEKEGLKLRLLYKPEVYGKEQAAFYLNGLVRILERMVEPGCLVEDVIYCLTERETEQVLHEFNQSRKRQSRLVVADLLKEQFVSQVDKTAVMDETRSLTYGELEVRAGHVAAAIQEKGYGRNDVVAITADRTVDAIVLFTGVLLSGAAFLPIDPQFPEERIAYMLEDCKPVLILNASVEADFAGYGVEVLGLDDIGEGTPDQERKIYPEDLSYVIYTSGTTGKPKGVLIEQAGVANLAEYFIKDLEIKPGMRVLQYHNFIFDGAVWEIIMGLCTGGTLCILPRELMADAYEVRNYIIKNQIQVAALPPQLYLQQEEYELDTIITAGSQAVNEVVEKSRLSRRYINSYGPTEGTVCATHWIYQKGMEIPDRIPIGKPVANKSIYILDGMNLCGIGMIGELCIGGCGLARGYQNLEVLTKEKFIENPYGSGRLYRTGDLARWLPDGNIEYLGRTDEQIKVRGFRVELPEVEQVIRKQKEVQDVTVISKQDDNGENYLAAYVVSSEPDMDTAVLMEKIRKELPDYMVPAGIMKVEQIPMTRNGKVDRRALPEISFSRRSEYVAPANEVEERIVKIFETILSVDHVGTQDNFFELGGHSLRAARLTNEIEAAFHVRIPLKEVFANPTPALLAGLLSEQEKADGQEIPKAEKKEYYKMSSTQKRIYFVCGMDDSRVAYNMPAGIRLQGEVDRTLAEKAFQGLVTRHESLRTSFHVVQGEYVQKIHKPEEVKVSLAYEEREGIRYEEQMERFQSFVRPFDLEQAPLIRMLLLKTGDQEYDLFLDMHHIVSDGASMRILLEDFMELYNGNTLPALKRQYIDYSEWMEERDWSTQKAYWKAVFADEVPLLNLPLDLPRPQQQSFHGNKYIMKCSKEFAENVKAFAKRSETTDYMVLLSGFMALLAKYSRQNDIVVGTTVSGRTNQDTEEILGMFANTLAMRGKPEGSKTFSRFLSEMKENCLTAYENQEYPFEKLLEEMDIPKRANRNPLFDVMFVMQNNELPQMQLRGVENAKGIMLEDDGAKFDLTVSVQETDGQYQFVFEYCDELFFRETIKSLAEHYKNLMMEFMKNPERQMGEATGISEEEKKKILGKFNASKTEYERDKTVAQLFEEQAAQRPDSIAVEFGDSTYTYQQLNETADRFASRILQEQVQPEDCIVVLGERSKEMIAAIIGILKAGCAYVPIDVNYPEERIRYIIKDCNPKLIFCDDEFLKIGDSISCISLFEELPSTREKTAVAGGSRNLAYIIYTSGTTGKPKGTLVENRSIVRLVNHTEIVPLSNRTVIFQTGAMAFDASTFEVWGALLNGGRLILAEKDVITNPKEMKRIIKEKHVNTMWLTATLFNQLVDTDASIFESLTYLLAGGEKLSEKHVRKFYQKISKVQLINGYGPTENTTFTATYPIPTDFTKIWIGKPVSNTQIYIMDGDTLCGIGVPGELCTTGDGVARGYLNLEELTKEKFKENPFGTGKMYRTGDLARWTEDGNIEYLGRIDEQVKIRGFRIELEEIENVLKSEDGIDDASVLVRVDAHGEKYIAAYFSGSREISIAELKERMKKRLPDYMIPAGFKRLEKLPVNQNGKVDKTKLPEVEFFSSNTYREAETELEQVATEAFCQVLNLEKAGADDNFFELGGHSLKASALINEIEAKTGIRIPLKEVYYRATPALLAEYLEEHPLRQYERILPARKQDSYPMSATQKRLFVLDQIDDMGIAYNMPSKITLKGSLDIEKAQHTLQELVNRHEVLRTEFCEKDGEPVQCIKDNAEITIGYRKVMDGDETTVRKLFREFVRPFDLGKAPLMRCEAVELSETETVLFFDMHHIIGDGHSMSIIMKEFNDIYNGEVLKELAVQYKDYSEWMRTRNLSGQRAFWLSQMEGDLEPLNLPLDYKRPQYQTFHGDSIFLDPGQEFQRDVRKFAERTGTSEYMVLLSAFFVLLGKYDDKEDFIVGSPVSGRTHKDTENMLGMFVNTLAMRGKPKKDMKFIDFLMEMKETCIKAFENQEYPFEELIEELDIPRDISRNPLFDLMFVFQNGAKAVVDLMGIEQNENFSSEDFVAKFDMTVNINTSDHGYHMMFEYNTDLFKKESVEYFACHYVELVKELLAEPKRVIKEYTGLSDGEYVQVTEEFNKTGYSYDKSLTAGQLLWQQVKEHGQETAVYYEGTSLAYQEFYEKAMSVASTLHDAGIGRNDFVVLLAERSAEMVIGIFGIILAGAAFVPLDPEHPAERIRFILEDCQAKAVLVTRQVTADVKDIPVLVVEDICQSDTSTVPYKAQNQAEDLLYMIYTSGTTGKPKGVMVEHSGVVNMSMYFQNTIGVTKEDRILQLHNYIFDGAVWEIMMALTTGASLYVVPKTISADPDGIEHYIKEHGITIAALPPQVYMQQNSYPIEKLITAGSEASCELVEKAEENASVYINSYGPTECTVCVTHWEHRKGDKLPARIPIGKPIMNKQIYIVRENRLCGIGMPGELCVAGKGLARGYFKQEELTKEKFTSNPYGTGRLYHTGDLARWLPDGTVEYLGRIDQQVKIRGFRVELLEIETVLRNYPGIADAAVIARKDEEGENYISAFVTAKDGNRITIREIKKALSDELPAYMVPAVIMELDRIPMTTSGKVDTRQLPETISFQRQEYVAPRNQEEQKIADIFVHVLDIDKAGATDNFFELGGHSLKATKVINEIEMLTGKRLALKEIFENPTVELLAAKAFSEEGKAYEAIPKAEERAYYPMSSVQRRLFLVHEMTDANTAYNTPAAIVLRGALDLEKVQSAFQQLVDRHEILRTHFEVIEQENVQVIEPSVTVKAEYVRTEELTREEQLKMYEDFIKPFDLHQVPLIRMKVVEMKEHSILMVDMHHIISDGQSIQILLREFTQLYMGVPLAEKRLQYRDYSEWMNARDLEGQRAYWLSQFAELPEPLDLGTDYPRPQTQNYQGALYSIRIDKEIRKQIQVFSAKEDTTEFTVLVSMVMLLLSKYSRQTDITVGCPFSGRTHYDVQDMLGMFVNTLVLRGNADPDKQFKDYMLEIKKMCMDALENQDYPFEDLVEETAVPRDMARNPLFDVLFTYQNNEQTKAGNGIFPESEVLEPGSAKAKFDISITFVPDENGYEMVLEYAVDLFKEETIRGMAEHLKNLLSGISSMEQHSLGEINLLSPEEEKAVRDTFNQTTMEYQKDATVISLWKEQVEKHRNEKAVIAKDGFYTYEEAERASNALAVALREYGVKKNDIVAIVHGRTRNLLVAMLGILKAGAGYLPVDPTLPEERIRFMLEDSHSQFVIVDEERLSSQYENVRVLKDLLTEYEEKERNVNQAESDGISYIIYTSGSTGKPKGTVLSNKNLMNFCSNNTEVVDAIWDSGERKMVSTTTVSFDIFVTESWLCLTNGITVVLADEEEQNNQKRLAELVEREGRLALQTTPSKMKAFMYDKTNLSYLKQLTVIILGGEAFPDALYEEMRKYTDAVIFNIYGPSETTVWITTKKIESEKVTIGKPFSNTQIYILEKGRLCGIGIPGELCIAGDSVGYGYLNREELTKEKFVENPFGEGMMYRSGDVAKWLPDGNIAYLGRMDDQVKIHGLRIELKEIESCMEKLDGIQNAAVVVKEADGDKRLCAYYVSEKEISINEIKTQLRKLLPEYMVPPYMMQLGEIPRNNNGKLDRKALPQIEGMTKREIVKPRNELERMVTEAFAEILEIEEVSIYDSFFELGGNSLKVATLINQLEQKTGIRIPFKKIFTETTPVSIAGLLEQAEHEEAEQIMPAEEKSAYPMAPAQRRIYVVQQIDRPGTAYNMPTAMEIQGNLDIARANKAFQKLLAKHETLRTSFHEEGEAFVQKIHATVTGGLEYADYTGQDADIKQLMQEFVRPFDLGTAPLVRVKAVKLGEERYLLLFDMHHIISDGASIAILVEEFCKAYGGQELETLRVQYKDYSEWIRKKDLDGQKQYWLGQFGDTIPVLDLPYDHPRAQSQSYTGSAVMGKTDLKLVQKVEQLAKETGTTEYMVLLSVFNMLLGKYSRQDDIIVGTPVSGRVHADTENMIGMFVNTLAMRSFPEADKDYRTYLGEVKEMCLMAYENQEYPFEDLVEQVKVERDLSRNPLFDVMFVLQNNKEAVLKLDENTMVKEMEPDYTVSKFDITANVKRSKDGYLLVFEYCTSLFEQESMEYFMEHYLNLLKAVVSNPEQKLKDYSELGQKEWKLIQDFNATNHPAEEMVTVLELFEEQVKKTPDNVAVEYQNESITYRKFNEKVNQLAYQLRELGVGRDEFVCIIAKRSIQMMIGIFAVIKAGGAYVPIDANYPEERIRYIIADCKAKAVLLAKAELAIETEVPVIDLMDETVYHGNIENPCIINQPKDLIYLIYTSGTTGQPKGVMNTREGCTNYMRYRQAEHALGAQDRVLQKTTYTFDVSVWEIIWWSTTGARVVMLEQGDEKDVEAICNEIHRKKITVMHFVPSMLQVFVSHLKLNPDERYKVTSLEAVYASGEALKPDTVKMFHEVLPETTELINLYGPTEASIDVTRFACDKDYEKILIGKPIYNTQIYILNGETQCGIGVPGELGIAGKGLARGYLNREDLTQEKFIKNPFGEGRLYRTGDLARLLPDGNIEYLGRIDEQVKIRGFRIELGEIENVIRKQENVRDVAVIAREDANGEKFIAAYVVRYDSSQQDFDDLKSAIRSTLPDYMVPAAFTQIESIPVTKNGKLDRRALPEIERVSDREYVAPETEEQKMLAEILSEVLGVKKVGLYDDFYELGGDSIKAIRVVSKLREAGFKLDVKEIMQERTLQGMAGYLSEAEETAYEQGEVIGEVLSTPIEQEFLQWNLTRKEHFNQCIMLEKEGQFEREALEAALEAIWKQHDMLRSVLKDKRQYILSSEERKLELSVYDFRGQTEQQVKDSVKAQCQKIQESFDLENGPLMKVALYQTQSVQHLFICIHHLVIDGVSWRVLLEDLISAYKQYSMAQTIGLPRKTASYKLWAEALHEFAEREIVREEIPYWNRVKEQIGDMVPRTAQEKKYQTQEVQFTEMETDQILHEAISAYNTDTKELLMTGLSRAIEKTFGKERAVVLMEGHGREEIHKEIHIDRTVGWFTSIYPVVTEYKEELDEHIIYIKEMFRKVPKNGFGLGVLKYLGEYEFDVEADITFNYLGDFGKEVSEDSDIRISSFDCGESSSPDNQQMTELTVNGSVSGGILKLDVTYNSYVYHELEMEQFTKILKEETMLVCNYCCGKEETVVTASDIGAGDMDEDELSALLDLL